jgi:hypothetical protein
MSSTRREASRIAALETAEAVVSGRLGMIEGCRLLHALGLDLVPDVRSDADFVVFDAVDSETDALPTGSARRYWDPVALRREDREVQRAEAMYRDEVVAACRHLIDRFRDVRF